MSKPAFWELVRAEWQLTLVLGLVVAAIPFGAYYGWGTSSSEPRVLPQAVANAPVQRVPKPSVVRPTEPRATDQDVARQTIAEHQARLDANPKSDDAPALLSAMGNLYRQKLLDYEQAAGCFERLISDYPQWPSVRDAYLQLVVCYDRLGDLENRSSILRRIMSDFPPQSEEYLFASRELGIVSPAPEPGPAEAP